MAIPAPTLEKAIQNEQLCGFLCMNVKDIPRYLAPLSATPKGRMKKPKAGIRSTQRKDEKIEQIIDDNNMHPKDGSTSSEGAVGKIYNIFCVAVLSDKEKGTVLDATALWSAVATLWGS